jgi:hypothetical protein
VHGCFLAATAAVAFKVVMHIVDVALFYLHLLQGISGLDAFPLGGVATTCGTPDHMATANLQMALQQQQAALQMAQSGMLPGAGALPPQQAAAMAQAAALMAGMNTADASMQAAAGLQGFNMMPPMMPDASAAGEAPAAAGLGMLSSFVLCFCLPHPCWNHTT